MPNTKPTSAVRNVKSAASRMNRHNIGVVVGALRFEEAGEDVPERRQRLVVGGDRQLAIGERPRAVGGLAHRLVARPHEPEAHDRAADERDLLSDPRAPTS